MSGAFRRLLAMLAGVIPLTGIAAASTFESPAIAAAVGIASTPRIELAPSPQPSPPRERGGEGAKGVTFAATSIALSPEHARGRGLGEGGSSSATALPQSVQQGSLVFGQTRPGSTVSLHGKPLRVSSDGRFAFGVGRDEARDARLDVTFPDGRRERIDVAVKKRDWPIERVSGVPQQTVDPPPEIAARTGRTFSPASSGPSRGASAGGSGASASTTARPARRIRAPTSPFHRAHRSGRPPPASLRSPNRTSTSPAAPC